jgi:hypothetical protein
MRFRDDLFFGFWRLLVEIRKVCAIVVLAFIKNKNKFLYMAKQKSNSAAILENIKDVLPQLEEFYMDLHAHPELSMQETRTSGKAADWMHKFGVEVTTGIGKTGVVGLLRNGEGPTVMLRADMDALPVQEKTGLPYASQVMA